MKSFLRVKLSQVMAALIMAIVVWVTVVGLGLNTGITGAAPAASRFNTGIAGATSLSHKCEQDQMDQMDQMHQMHQTAPLWEPRHECFNIHKVPLTRTNRDCMGNVVGTPLPTPTFGFSIIIKTRSGWLFAVVVLRNATPNATYNIRLIQTPNMLTSCPVVPGGPTLMTDANGNGIAFVREFLQPGSSDAFVVLNNADVMHFPNDFFTTREVFFNQELDH